MKRCAQCHGRLGLGVRSRNLWSGRWRSSLRAGAIRRERTSLAHRPRSPQSAELTAANCHSEHRPLYAELSHAVGLFENADYDPPDVAIAVHVRGLPARAARKSVRNLLCCREQHNFGSAGTFALSKSLQTESQDGWIAVEFIPRFLCLLLLLLPIA
jgi:hypothetical protein